jgi:tetrahydromethanopterin S-methyltransferase subunit F
VGRGQERLSSAGRGMTIAGLIVGVVCLLLTVPFLMGSID